LIPFSLRLSAQADRLALHTRHCAFMRRSGEPIRRASLRMFSNRRALQACCSPQAVVASVDKGFDIFPKLIQHWRAGMGPNGWRRNWDAETNGHEGRK